MNRRHASGFTLIELMIGIAIVGILIMVGLPTFGIWIQNLQVRTGAEGVLNGLQVARTEAVRRNVNVQFTLAALPQTGWTVTIPGTGEIIQNRSGQEGSANAIVTVTPGGASTVTFNGLGRVVGNADATASITQLDVDSSTLSAADSRELRIVVGGGGNIRMCEPMVAAGDPRAC